MPVARRDAGVFQQVRNTLYLVVLVGTVSPLLWMATPPLPGGWQEARLHLFQPLALPEPWGLQSVVVQPYRLMLSAFFAFAAALVVLLLRRLGRLGYRLKDHASRPSGVSRIEGQPFPPLGRPLQLFVLLGLTWVLAWITVPVLMDQGTVAGLDGRLPLFFLAVAALMLVPLRLASRTLALLQQEAGVPSALPPKPEAPPPEPEPLPPEPEPAPPPPEPEPLAEAAAALEPQAAASAPEEQRPAALPSMLGWLSQRRAVVALDLGHGAAKILQGVRDQNGVRLTGAAWFVLPPGIYRRGRILDPIRLAALLRERLDALRIKSTRVVASVGGESSILRTVPFPRMSEAELQEALKWEAEKYFPFRHEEAVVDFKLADVSTKQLWPASDVAQGQVPVMLGGCQRTVVTAFTDTFAQPGLRAILAELEPQPLAVFRALRHTEGADKLAGVVALVEIGLDGVNITIFKHGYPLMHRSIHGSVFATGPEYTLEPWRMAAASPPVDETRMAEVFRQVDRSLEVALVQLKPAQVRVYVTGDGAAVPHVVAALDASVRSLFAARFPPGEGAVANPFSWDRGRQWPSPVPPVLQAAPPAWAGAFGLLLRGLKVAVPQPPVVEDEDGDLYAAGAASLGGGVG